MCFCTWIKNKDLVTVGMRCAMLITVCDANSSCIVLRIRASVWASTDAVASSSTKILVSFRSACPKQNNCLCPTLQFSPFSNTWNHHHHNHHNKKTNCDLFAFGEHIVTYLTVMMQDGIIKEQVKNQTTFRDLRTWPQRYGGSSCPSFKCILESFGLRTVDIS